MEADTDRDNWIPFSRPKRWRWKIYAAILKRRLFVLCSLAQPLDRNKRYIQKSYAGVWRESPGATRTTAPKRTIRDYQGELYEVPKAAMRKVHLAEMSAALGRVSGVESVLELGCGNGINLLAFAVLHPGLKIWRGVELTREGVAAAERMRSRPPLEDLRYLTGLLPEVISERLSRADIRFQQGSILDLPFPDRSFDVVFSRLVLEQLPRDHPKAFREARRVSKKSGLFFEEFREAQKNIFQRMQLKNLDYFRASYRELEQAGWQIESFQRSAINKVQFSFGLAVCT